MNDPVSSRRVGVGLIGSQFITSIHAEALRACSQAEIRAVASPTPGNAGAFAQRHGILRGRVSCVPDAWPAAPSGHGGRALQARRSIRRA